jgi:hypothetical protein
MSAAEPFWGLSKHGCKDDGFYGLRVVLQGFSMRQPNMNAISASGGARSVLSVSERSPLHVTAVTEDQRSGPALTGISPSRIYSMLITYHNSICHDDALPMSSLQFLRS